MPQKANTPITCVVCGATKLTTPRSARAQKFCSAACQGMARRGKYFGTRATANRICRMCDRPFHAKQVDINKGIAKYCSVTCRGGSQQIPLAIPRNTEDLIYMAGIVDGEGTITVGAIGTPRIMVANCSVILMDWIVASFGGRPHLSRAPRSPRHRPIVCWYLGADQTVTLCRMLLPYLKIKQRQAELIIAAHGLAPNQRAALIIEIRKLNKRGI